MIPSLCLQLFLFASIYGFAHFYAHNDLRSVISLIGLHTAYIVLAWFVAKFVLRKFVQFALSKVDPSKKCVLITGCDTGFGHLFAKRFSSLGFHVFAGCLNENNELSSHQRITVVQLDITDEASVRRVLAMVEEHIQKNDLEFYGLVNNAGVAIAGLLEWNTLSATRRVWEVNYEGTLRMCRTFLPLLRHSKGRLVNIGSVGSRSGYPFLGAYNSSKAAIKSVTEALRRELYSFDVTVVLVEPTGYRTTLTDYSNMALAISKSWSATDGKVKESYGAKFVDHILDILNLVQKTSNFVDFGRSSRTDLVVDAVVEAMTSYSPQAQYVPCPWYVQPVVTFVDFAPSDFLDTLCHLYVKLILLSSEIMQILKGTSKVF